LSTLLLEREAIGFQAGSSSLIRNYLGFPRGTSGRGLATRAFAQVWSFGADTVVTWPVTGLRPAETGYQLSLADGSEVHGRSVVIATGVSYRRLDVPGVAPLVGAGVYYGAAASEARAMAGRRGFIAGGANSAGQAAVNLARHAGQFTLLVEQAAAVPSSGSIALQGLPDEGRIQPGQRLLINGAGGGVGTFAVQLAKAYGADVTGVDGTGKLDMVRSIGADHVFDYTQEDFTLSGELYDLILDIPGNHQFSDCKRALTPKGRTY